MTNGVPVHVQKIVMKNIKFLPVFQPFFWLRVDIFSEIRKIGIIQHTIANTLPVV